MSARGRDRTLVSRAVTSQDLADLLSRATQAAVAFVNSDGALEAFPVAFTYRDGSYLFSTGERGSQLAEGQRVSLLIDEGCYHTELRGVRARGPVRPVETPWLEVFPEKLVAWDYGAMREMPR